MSAATYRPTDRGPAPPAARGLAPEHQKAQRIASGHALQRGGVHRFVSPPGFQRSDGAVHLRLGLPVAVERRPRGVHVEVPLGVSDGRSHTAAQVRERGRAIR